MLPFVKHFFQMDHNKSLKPWHWQVSVRSGSVLDSTHLNNPSNLSFTSNFPPEIFCSTLDWRNFREKTVNICKRTVKLHCTTSLFGTFTEQNDHGAKTGWNITEKQNPTFFDLNQRSRLLWLKQKLKPKTNVPFSFFRTPSRFPEIYRDIVIIPQETPQSRLLTAFSFFCQINQR